MTAENISSIASTSKPVLAQYGFQSEFWSLFASLHDALEDTLKYMAPLARRGLTAQLFGEEVGRVVSGFGETRKIRNADIKAKIIEDVSKLSAIGKLADRIANATTREVRCSPKGSSYFEMYRKELRDFETTICGGWPPSLQPRRPREAPYRPARWRS
jgi:(p)ppGpp synthase/HD superfamily hydrolase